MKLMPGLFTTEEMALSRSQGLLAKKGDLRPALDKDKVLVLKDAGLKRMVSVTPQIV